MSRYRFALRPRWIVSHLFVLALVAGMLWAGFWQLHRLDERKDLNATVAARAELEPVDAVELATREGADSADDLEYRRVTVTGRYLLDEEVLVRSRSLNGAPGSWVLTPVQVDDDTAVVVNRGWISNSGDLEAVPEEFSAPEGPVEVDGLVRVTETRGRFGAEDPSDGQLTDMARADVERIDRQVDADLVPFYVQLLEQSPPVDAASDPEPVPPPSLDEGPHLSYAVQWFIFTTVALVGYPLILRRRAREVEIEELPGTDAETEEPVSPGP